jgi:hypothetical protein
LVTKYAASSTGFAGAREYERSLVVSTWLIDIEDALIGTAAAPIASTANIAIVNSWPPLARTPMKISSPLDN